MGFHYVNITHVFRSEAGSLGWKGIIGVKPEGFGRLEYHRISGGGRWESTRHFVPGLCGRAWKIPGGWGLDRTTRRKVLDKIARCPETKPGFAIDEKGDIRPLSVLLGS